MKILVTGGAGYIGSVLVRRLLRAGHNVTVLDRFFFGTGPLAGVAKNPRLKTVRGDTRWFDGSILAKTDAVLDLAALSNDPSGELDPEKTMEINYRGRARVARLAKKHGVKRYVLASSCSIYGFREGILDEESPVNPLTTYAKANRMAEEAALKLAGPKFCPVALRFATVFGLSPRMRFDLAVNAMVLGLSGGGKLKIMRDGRQWRPFIHVSDAAAAYLSVLSAPADETSGQIFNAGSDDNNWQVLPLAKEVAKAAGAPLRKEWYGDPDKRSYRISFAKIRRLGYSAQLGVGHGAAEIAKALASGKTEATKRTRTVEWYSHLLESQRIAESVSLGGRIL